jgi:hypothetical protein
MFFEFPERPADDFTVDDSAHEIIRVTAIHTHLIRLTAGCLSLFLNVSPVTCVLPELGPQHLPPPVQP